MRTPFFHVAFVVPDLKESMEATRRVLPLEWRPATRVEVTVAAEDGTKDIEVAVTFSQGPAPAIELLEAVPGTVLAGEPDRPIFHHLGWFVDDLGEEAASLERLSCPLALTVPGDDGAPSRFSLHEGPLGGYIELVDLGVDRPHIRDLFPAS